MPFYIISNESYVKDNIYKFGYSSKSKEELLMQYSKNKRLIINPFILKWWNVEGSIKEEKKIHNILGDSKNITRINNEWYKCHDLFLFMFIINEQINNHICINEENKKSLTNFFDKLCVKFDLLDLSIKDNFDYKNMFYELKKDDRKNY